MKWYKVEGLNYNGRPFIKKIPVGGKKICLVGYDNELFALAAKCPHAGEDITRGWCSDGKLVCPFHRFSYNLSTGRGSPGQGDYIETYAVKVNDGGIYIGFETWKEKFKKMFE